LQEGRGLHVFHNSTSFARIKILMHQGIDNLASLNIYNSTILLYFIVSLVPIVLSLPVVRWIMDMIVIYMFQQQVLTCKSIPTMVTMLSASVIVGGEA
jgi:hypothetical protein